MLEPPPKGNQRGRRHGGHAVIARSELTEVGDAIRQVVPVQHQADDWTIRELADALVRLGRFRDYIDAHDPWSGSKAQVTKVRSAMRHEERMANRVLRLLRELGMTPASRAKLGVDIARSVSLAEAMSEPDAAKRADLLRQAGLDPDE